MNRVLVDLMDRVIAWRTGRHYHERLARFQEMDRWPREQLREWQWKRLGALLDHAYETVPYYRAALDELGGGPPEFRSPESFARLPILTKQIINARRQDLMSSSPAAGRATLKSTGGSTGTRIWFHVDSETHDCRRAAGRLSEWWDGVVPGTRTATLWGAALDASPSRLARLYDKLTNRLFLSVYGVDDDDLVRYHDILCRFRPEVLQSYPSILLHIARCLGRRRCREIGARLIYSSAEALSPAVREELEDLFGSQVRNRYASREFGMIAGDCPEGDGLYVCDMRLYVELAPEGVPGAPRELIITDLDARAMPLIRYKINDLALPLDHPDPAGRPWSRLASVEGRSFDVVITPEGRAFGGTFFTLVFRPVAESILQYQVVQETRDHLRIRIVPGVNYNDRRRALLEETLRRQLGPTMGFDIEELPEIECLPSGKRRFVVSKIGGLGGREKVGSE